VAAELEGGGPRAAARDRRGGGSAGTCGKLSPDPPTARRLLDAAELAFNGSRDLVSRLLGGRQPGWSHRTERMAWIGESFTDGIPRDAARIRSLVGSPIRGDMQVTPISPEPPLGAARQSWWADRGGGSRLVVAPPNRWISRR
jgi:hypothetical protein